MICEKCKIKHDGNFGSGRFCSRSCANSKIFSKESKIKKSIANKKYYKENPDKIRRGFKHTKEHKEHMSKIIKQHHKNGILKNWSQTLINKNIPSGNSYLRKNEKILKPKIESYLNTTNLFPQKIGKHWFDLVNKKYIIEHSNDYGYGISNAIKRFKTITDDKRIKYLIAPNKYFGTIRKQRLYQTGTKFIPLEQFI